ncbi:MAG TPA: hypothetical protein VI387_11605 [Candidatus Brocadiales bacterium]|nr:hypothetical protein [Candidatus Brocadiales bacterium]
MKEPRSMEEIHKIREELSKEWRIKSRDEIEKDREKIRKLATELGLNVWRSPYPSPQR